MVKIDYSFQHTIIEKELLEPRIAGFRTRYLCYLIALLFVAEDAFKLYLTKINYYGLPDPYFTHVIWPLNISLHTVSILSCICLVFGMKKPNSTAIAVFLWTQFEVNVIFIPFVCYEGMEDLITLMDQFQMLGILIIKICLWWNVNSFHSYLKEREFIERGGGVRTSKAFTKLYKYYLPGQKTSI